MGPAVPAAPAALLDRVTCPHCWAPFEPAEVLWVAAHPDLRGDPRLGPDAYRRFLPSRFTAGGGAVDDRDQECAELACPRCHLTVPRLCTELPAWIVSVFGAPAAGKSYFLAAMTTALRRRMAAFRLSFADADASANQVLAGYEQALFAHPTPDELVPLGELIVKTQEQGDLYNTSLLGSTPVQLPRPFLFRLRPEVGHPLAADPGGPHGRVVTLYDNAGESFTPGRDSTANPVTRHLAESSALLFLFDPTQYQPFRARLGGAVASDAPAGPAGGPQHLILTEAAGRVRRFARLRDTDKHTRPLVVVVAKQDVWGNLIPDLATGPPVVTATLQGTGVMIPDRLEEVSRAIRRLLRETTPEVVAAAEGFAEKVVYVGVSALGAAPVRHPVTGRWAVRPRDIKPAGVEVPILYALQQTIPRLIPTGRRK